VVSTQMYQQLEVTVALQGRSRDGGNLLVQVPPRAISSPSTPAGTRRELLGA